MRRFGFLRNAGKYFIPVLTLSLGLTVGGMVLSGAPARADSFGFGVDSDGDVSVYFHGGDDRRHHKKYRRYRNDYYKGYNYGYRKNYYDRRGYSHRHGNDNYFSFSFQAPRRGHRHYDDRYYGGYSVEPWRARCHPVSKRGYWHGAPAKIGGTMCYDRYGRSYIAPGSRHLIHYY